MRFFSVTFLLGLVLAFLAFCSTTAEGTHQPHLRVRRGGGCPIPGSCVKSCQDSGRKSGTCVGPRRSNCVCTD
ncbi:defensin-like [Dermacentor variabilis]|uniref:defensin-like n=1 Tax=Dermacentor variabilis TaxID=34621 RepID=UPI003F5C149B